MPKRCQGIAGATAAFRAGAALLSAAFAPQLGQAQETPSAWNPDDPTPTLRGVWYTGYDTDKGSHYVFSGATVALDGDLSRNGFHVRLYGSLVDYDRDPGNGRGYQSDLMLGYRVSHGRVDAGLYIGVDYQNYRLDPDDPTEEPRGTEWGFKVVADVETQRENSPIYYALDGEYSTAFRTYWARARVGANLRDFTFGPEGAVLGDVSFVSQRVGAFAIFDVKMPQIAPLDVTLHAGYQFVAGGGDGTVGGGEGAYGGVVLRLLF